MFRAWTPQWELHLQPDVPFNLTCYIFKGYAFPRVRENTYLL